MINFTALRTRLETCLPSCSYVSITCDPSKTGSVCDAVTELKLPDPELRFADVVNLASEEWPGDQHYIPGSKLQSA